MRGGGNPGSSHPHPNRIAKAARAPLAPKRAALRGVAAKASSPGFDPLAEKFYTAEDLAKDAAPTWSVPEKAAEAGGKGEAQSESAPPPWYAT